MVNYGSPQLAALCAVVSFLWLSYTLEKHSLHVAPRISAVLILFCSGIATFGLSLFSRWLPGANGRFDDEIGYPDHVPAQGPRRPRRFFLPLVVAAFIVRLETFHYVSSKLQCSQPGLETLLPMAFVAYDLLRSHKGPASIDDDDDIANTVFDDIKAWIWKLWQYSSVLVIGTIIFAYGAYQSAVPSNKSTFFCSVKDNGSLVRFFQAFGLCLDAVIAVTLWRILAWTRTTKSRLKTIGGILLASALFYGTYIVGVRLFYAWNYMGVAWYRLFGLPGFSSIFYFDVFVDGLTFATFLVSSALFICEASPLELSSAIVFICALISSFQKVLLLGTYEQVSRSSATLPLSIICIGYPLVLYTNNIRYVLFVPRTLLVLLLVPTVITALIISLVKDPILDRHPVDKLIYDARIGADRWLTQASVSKTLRVAAQEYQERNHGRNPPPNFDVWYKFATDRSTVIIDNFSQIEDDIHPFWGVSPAKIRESIAAVSEDVDIELITVKNGQASHGLVSDKLASESRQLASLIELVDLMQGFAKYLPDMELPINLADHPRVLAPWDDIHRYTESAKSLKFKLLSRRSDGPRMSLVNDEAIARFGKREVTSMWDLRRQLSQTCAPGTKARSESHWNVRDFCASCANPQAEGHFLKNADMALDICHQPDIPLSHGLFMNLISQKPHDGLVPVFSRSKTAQSNDILIPLPRLGDGAQADTGADFTVKATRLVWRGDSGVSDGDFTPPISRGGHQGRLSHLVNNASAADKATIVLSTPSNKDRYAYEKVDLSELNSALPIDGGISSWGDCRGSRCGEAKRELGMPYDMPDYLKNRYILTVDSDDGPSKDILTVLKSTSVPFVATIFKEWYTERLLPWVHYVPIDLRFHALHSTLAYFTGLKGRGKVGGREVDMEARLDDAKWIADQGRRWAEKAIRREDMEIYLFRLLLEWGRVIDDKRDEIGFTLEEKREAS